MENRFKKLDIECNFYHGIKPTDKRLKYVKNRFNIRQWSITYGHLDIIHDFYYYNNNDYAVICEDDIVIHKDFKKIFEKVIIDFTILNLDILLLGYIIPYHIDNRDILSNYPLKHKIIVLDSVYNYHKYPDYLSGSHMYIITKSFAKSLLDKYYTNFAEFDKNGFMIDKTIIKEGNRALLYPMLAIENSDFQEDKYHKLCHKIHYGKFYI